MHSDRKEDIEWSLHDWNGEDVVDDVQVDSRKVGVAGRITIQRTPETVVSAHTVRGR